MSEPIVVALIVAAAPMVTVTLAWWQQRKKIEQIHFLVNSRLSEALEEIRLLKAEVARLHKKEDAC